MKRICLILALSLMLCGCAGEETLETVADVWAVPVMGEPREIRLELPGETSVCAMESDSGRLYLGDDYEISVQTLAAGDVSGTIRAMTGFDRDALTVLKTDEDGCGRYEFVWTCAGENGDRLGHGILLDDGTYHYCLSVLRSPEESPNRQIVWSQVYQSFSLA